MLGHTGGGPDWITIGLTIAGVYFGYFLGQWMQAKWRRRQ